MLEVEPWNTLWYDVYYCFGFQDVVCSLNTVVFLELLSFLNGFGDQKKCRRYFQISSTRRKEGWHCRTIGNVTLNLFPLLLSSIWYSWDVELRRNPEYLSSDSTGFIQHYAAKGQKMYILNAVHLEVMPCMLHNYFLRCNTSIALSTFLLRCM